MWSESVFVLAPEGRQSVAQGVSPGNGRSGRTTSSADPGLTPWATDYRPLRGLNTKTQEPKTNNCVTPKSIRVSRLMNEDAVRLDEF
jgi:hypothetical protein